MKKAASQRLTTFLYRSNESCMSLGRGAGNRYWYPVIGTHVMTHRAHFIKRRLRHFQGVLAIIPVTRAQFVGL